MIALGSAITTVKLSNTSAAALTNAPITFGHVFAIGDLPGAGAAVSLRAPDNSTIPCQLDVRVLHGDGSVRHAIISAIVPALAASAGVTYSLLRVAAGAAPAPAVPADFPALAAVVSIVDAGVTYTASLATLLSGAHATPLAGNVASEWEGGVALKNGSGVEHPHLHVRFAARAYKGQNKARVDFALENCWAFDTTAKDVTYDVTLTVAGATVYTQNALPHYAGTRWRKLAWWNITEPPVHIEYNVPYLIGTQAVPNYDQTIVPSAPQAATFKANALAKSAPMQEGCANKQMSAPGGRPEIGILPGWTALYIISQLADAKAAMLIMGNQSGSWGFHVRDRNTGGVLSLNDHPYYSFSGTDADNINPATGLSEKAPTVNPPTANPNSGDIAHHPDHAYAPYLFSGDIYYLEELRFTALNCAVSQNGNDQRRQGRKGLLMDDQLRGQAWGLRSYAHAAYIDPDAARRAEYEYCLKSNIDWYDARYRTNTTLTGYGATNLVGFMSHGYGIVLYQGAPGVHNAIGNFQDDFFAQALGRGMELGYSYIAPFFGWKIRYQVARLYGEAGTCWVQAASFGLVVRAGDDTNSPFYTTYKQCYDATFFPDVRAAAQASNCATQEMATAWANHNNNRATAGTGLYMDGVSNPAVGDMDGYSDSDQGYPSNMQPAIAYAAMFDAPNGGNAWTVFDGRSVKPNYSYSPQFAIVPRTSVAAPIDPAPIDPPPPPPTLPPGETMTYKNRVKTSTTSTGTGNLTTGAAAARCRPLTAIPTGSTNVPLLIEDEAGTDWEFSYCTVLAGGVIQRDTVIDGSAFPAKTAFGAGVKTVFCDVPAENFDLFVTPTTIGALGVTLPDALAAAPASAISGTDLIPVAQGAATTGASANALALFAQTKYPSAKTATVRITAAGTIPLDFSTHHRRDIFVTVPGVTFTGPSVYGSVGDDFECVIWNASSGVVTLGSGIAGLPSGSTIPVGVRAPIRSTANAIYAFLGTAAPADTVAPTAVSAAVANATPTIVTISMSEPMDTANVPAASAFTVSGHTVSAVAISGSAINLTISAAFVNGEAARTAAYTKPGTANARDIAGNELANFTGLAITNNVAAAGDTTAPTLSSPTGTQTGATTASGSVSTNEANGTLYRLISMNATETAATIKAANLTQAVTATGVQNVSATGLTTSTAYYWHFVHIDANGNESAAVHSAQFVTAAPSGGSTAPFAVTAKTGAPATWSSYDGANQYVYTTVAPTGAATVSSMTWYLSTSNSIHPASNIGSATSPMGKVMTTGGGSNNDYYTFDFPLGYSITGTQNFYFWVKIVDSNGATWWFLRPTAIPISDAGAKTTTTAPESLVQA